MKRNEVFEALAIIKKECQNRRICDGCLFNGMFDADGKRICTLNNYPKNWKMEARRDRNESHGTA